MNTNETQPHPAPEEWADYLYGELPPETRARVDDHVRACPACQQQVGQWRETIAALDAWKLPRPARTARLLPAYARWAVAAAAAVGLGWLGGRFSAPAVPSAAQLTAGLVPALKAEVWQDFQTELTSAIQASDARNQDRLVELARAWADARDEDKQTILALYETLDRQHRRDQALLRRDLETVAVVAESAIGNTQQQLTQLAANSLATPVGGDELPR